MIANIKEIETEFLSFSKRNDGRYTTSELLRCRAFISFAHAEVKHYLENIANEALGRAEAKWDKNRSANKVVAGLLAYRGDKSVSLPDNPRQQKDQKKLATLVKGAFRNQRSIVKRNNGLKQKNIVEMYAPLAVELDNIEEKLLIELENFGVLRGDLVHTSTEVFLPKIRDPFADVKKEVWELVEDLEDFDNIVRKLF